VPRHCGHYESAAEAEAFEVIYRGHEDALRNTTFALLAPDGETKLCRSGRSPSFAFDDAAAFATGLKELVAGYKVKDKEQRVLPTARDLRLALNIAASDQQVVVVGLLRPEVSAEMLDRMTAAAWSEELQGRAHYALVTDTTMLAELPGFDAEAEVFVVRPDAWGAAVSIEAALKADAELLEGILPHTVTRNVDKSRSHIRDGVRQGRTWESVLEQTDPGRGPRAKQ